MKVAIDADPAAFVDSGVGVVSRALLMALFDQFPAIEFHCVLSSDARTRPFTNKLGQYPNVSAHFARESKKVRNLKSCLGQGRSFSQVIGFTPSCTLLLTLDFPDSSGPTVCLMHDLAPFRTTMYSMPWHGKVIWTNAIRKCRSAGTHFICVSEYTRRDLADWLGVNPNSIGLAHCGLETFWNSAVSSEEIEDFKIQHGLSKPYLYWAGVITRRKNVDGLLRAYASALQLRGGDLPDLVLVGPTGNDSKYLDHLPEDLQIGPRVHRFQRLSKEDLLLLVSGAAGLAFPSWLEGFGLPVIEALARGVPVMVSDQTSLPEIAGPNAVLCSPGNLASMRDGLIRLCTDGRLRTLIARDGPIHAARFSFPSMAQTIINECNWLCKDQKSVSYRASSEVSIAS